MQRYQKIARHKKFIKYAARIRKLEKDRIYCRHGTEHLLDVARIAYIKALEQKLPLSKDVVYGAALLHDIGKIKQYKKKVPHEIAGAKKAGQILRECGYTEPEIEMICQAILCHRRKHGKGNPQEGKEICAHLDKGGSREGRKESKSPQKMENRETEVLCQILYEADKESRMCMFCAARNHCNWTEEEKNEVILW